MESQVKLSVQISVGERVITTNLELGTATKEERAQLLAEMFKLLQAGPKPVITQDGVKAVETATEAAFRKFFEQVDGEAEPVPDNVNRPNLVLQNERLPDVPEEDQPEHWKTGILIKDGVKTYKCRQVCTCGTKTNRYILPNVTEALCRNCGTILKVRPAKEGHYLLPDEWKNFFWADEPVMHFSKYSDHH